MDTTGLDINTRYDNYTQILYVNAVNKRTGSYASVKTSVHSFKENEDSIIQMLAEQLRNLDAQCG